MEKRAGLAASRVFFFPSYHDTCFPSDTKERPEGSNIETSSTHIYEHMYFYIYIKMQTPKKQNTASNPWKIVDQSAEIKSHSSSYRF